VRMSVGGQNIDYTINWGAGGAGTQYWVLRLGVWMVTPGFKSASATLDIHNDIIESNGGDNTLTASFWPATFASKFIMPLERNAWTDWTMVNYTDTNLAPGVPGDYAGGSWTYDGHNGWDFTAGNWRKPDAGWDIYAAAGGTVVGADDGNYDRNSVAPYPPSNYVTIDHGNGFKTTYYHLRLNTVAVGVGDTVVKGQKIGEMGSSGSSTNPHLHWGVYYHDMLVEPAVDYLSYFASAMSYADNHDEILESGIINTDPTSQMYDGPVTINNFNPGDTAYFWGVLGGVGVGDNLKVTWRRPDNTVQETDNWNSGGEQYLYYWPSLNLPAGAQTGTWTATWEINNVVKSTRTFTVQSAARPAEARMTESDGTYLIDDRSTPFDLGTITQGGSTQPTFSFRLRNDGESNLTTSGLSVPSGFTVINDLAATIAPGSFDTVTLRLDSDYDGVKGGWVSFNTNDADAGESFMRFRIAGKVNKLTTVNGLNGVNDTIYIKRSGSDARIWVNTPTANPPTYMLPVSELDDVNFNTGSGDDLLTVDFSLGVPLGGNITFNASSDDDTMRLIGSASAETFINGPSGTTIGAVTVQETSMEELIIDAGGGDDTLNVNLLGYFDDLDQITHHVTFDGEAGTDDSVSLSDTDDVGAHTYTVNPTSVTRGGTFGGLTYHGTESLTLNANDSDNDINLNGGLTLTPTAWTINAGGGWDQINVGSTSVSSIDGAVVVNGGAGLDFISVNDQNSIATDAWTIDSNNALRAGFGGLTYGTIEGLTLNAQNVGSGITVTSSAADTPLAINAGGGDDVIHIVGHYIGTEVLVDSGDGDDVLNVNMDAAGVSRVRLNSSQTFSHINMANGGGIVMSDAGNRVLRATGLNLSGNSFIDLGDNDMIVDYSGSTPIATIGALLTSGYAGGAWTGPGIRSSAAAAATNTALGFAEASEIFNVFPASFAGQQVDDTAVLVKYTAVGDLNLDGNVNLQDFNRLASNFGQSGKRWTHGDLDFNGTVNLQDFNRLAGNFGMSGFGPDGSEGDMDDKLPVEQFPLPTDLLN
jgi:murein DD-endopeptidase MepM/ murein hydrolase activator NlpD